MSFPLQLLHKTLCRETFGLHLTYETHSFDRLFIWEAIHFMLQLSKHCGLLTQYIATWIWVNTGSGNGLLPASTLTLPSLRIKRRSEVNDRKNSLQSFKSFFSCDQAALWMVFSVRLSVCLSVCLSVRHTFLTMFPSSYHHEIFRSYY